MQNLKKVQNCASSLKRQLPQGFSPAIGIVLGTGLGDFAGQVQDKSVIGFESLPDFPRSTVASHRGAFVTGSVNGVPVVLQQGRCHLYEGRPPEDVCMGVRVMGLIGVKTLIITNAAGAINPRFTVGSLMLIEDQINFTGRSPLAGPNEDALGPRFPDVSGLYCPALGAILEETALTEGIRLEKGVYFGIPGPQLETRAETRAYRLLGGDAVGMSTVLEAVAAAHMGIRLAGLSCLTNKNLPDCMEKATMEDIIATATRAGGALGALLAAALPRIHRLQQ